MLHSFTVGSDHSLLLSSSLSFFSFSSELKDKESNTQAIKHNNASLNSAKHFTAPSKSVAGDADISRKVAFDK
jgi:hypothetical protein